MRGGDGAYHFSRCPTLVDEPPERDQNIVIGGLQLREHSVLHELERHRLVGPRVCLLIVDEEATVTPKLPIVHPVCVVAIQIRLTAELEALLRTRNPDLGLCRQLLQCTILVLRDGHHQEVRFGHGLCCPRFCGDFEFMLRIKRPHL